jgi:hypothetical protein
LKLPRRQFLHLGASAAALPALSHIASAQTYPTRPVRMLMHPELEHLPDYNINISNAHLNVRFWHKADYRRVLN